MAFLGIDFGVYNLFTCKGFEVAGQALGPVTMDIGGPCSMAKLGMVFLFFIIAIIRKWGGEELEIEFSFLWANILGLLSYFLVITFTGSVKLAFILGIALACVGGYGAGYFFNNEGSSEAGI